LPELLSAPNKLDFGNNNINKALIDQDDSHKLYKENAILKNKNNLKEIKMKNNIHPK